MHCPRAMLFCNSSSRYDREQYLQLGRRFMEYFDCRHC